MTDSVPSSVEVEAKSGEHRSHDASEGVENPIGAICSVLLDGSVQEHAA